MASKIDGGAWGFGIFQSDHDYGLVRSATIVLHIQPKEALPDIVQQAEDKVNAGGECLLIYAPLCSDVFIVRRLLDNNDTLVDFLQFNYREHRKDMKQGKVKTVDGYTYSEMGYSMVLFTACGMSLGCKLGTFKALARTIYRKVGLMKDALKQMQAALDPVHGYKDGTPWDFKSKSLSQTGKAGIFPSPEDQLCKNRFNVRPPGHEHVYDAAWWKQHEKDWQEAEAEDNDDDTDDMPETGTGRGMEGQAPISPDDDTPKVELLHNQGPLDSCGRCGSRKPATGQKNMVTCVDCKLQHYCSAKCRKTHRPIHKHNCMTAEQLVNIQQYNVAKKLLDTRGEGNVKSDEVKREALSKVHPLVRHEYVNSELRKMVMYLQATQKTSRPLPTDWDTTIQTWYRREMSDGPSTTREKVLINEIFMKPGLTAEDEMLEFMLMVFRDVTHGRIEGTGSIESMGDKDKSEHAKKEIDASPTLIRGRLVEIEAASDNCNDDDDDDDDDREMPGLCDGKNLDPEKEKDNVDKAAVGSEEDEDAGGAAAVDEPRSSSKNKSKKKGRKGKGKWKW